VALLRKLVAAYKLPPRRRDSLRIHQRLFGVQPPAVYPTKSYIAAGEAKLEMTPGGDLSYRIAALKLVLNL